MDLRTKFTIIVSLIFLIFLAWLTSPSNKPGDTASFQIQEGSIQDFALEDYEGNVFLYENFKGRPLVINSWASWCPFCLDELPDFVQLQKQYDDQIDILAINREESVETSSKFSDTLGITHELVWLLDPDDSFYRAINGFAMPETIFVNADGQIVEHVRGYMSFDEMKQKVQTIIE